MPPSGAQAPQRGHRPATPSPRPPALPGTQPPSPGPAMPSRGALLAAPGQGKQRPDQREVWGLHALCPPEGPQTEQEQQPHSAPRSLPSLATPQVHSTYQALEPSLRRRPSCGSSPQPRLAPGTEQPAWTADTEGQAGAPGVCGQKALDASSRAADPHATLRAVCLCSLGSTGLGGPWACGFRVGLGWGVWWEPPLPR